MFELQPDPAPHDAAGKAYWPTPAWATEALLDAHRISTAWVLEPSAGEGGIASVLARNGYRVAAVEIRDKCDTALRRALQPSSAHLIYTGGDFLRREVADWLPRGEPFSIIGNPPHDPADAMLSHVSHAVCSEAQCVCLLLPTTFLHSRGRCAFNLQHPPSALYPLARRPNCREDKSSGGGGKRDLAWFIYYRRWPSNKQRMQVIP